MKRFPIVKNAKIFFSITIIFLLVGFGSMIMKGFNLGIDFTGGSILDLKFDKPVTVAQVRDVLADHKLGNSVIQLGSADAVAQESQSVLVRTAVISDETRREVMNDMNAKLGNSQVLRVENVGATVGDQLVKQAGLAVVLSWILMIIYITFRFEFKFAISAIIALIIDVTVTLCWFSLVHYEIDSTFVAAILTVVGYSVNSTIVIFDRIRENLKMHRKSDDLSQLVENSIWQCMTRSMFTSLTTLFSVIAIFLYGGDTIHNFSFAMLVGISSGFYTSTFLAGPMWMFLKKSSQHSDGRVVRKTKVV